MDRPWCCSLRPFCEKEIPILWRPFHESDGTWFWWGAKGAEPVKKLYRIMYERFVGLHHLNNLIWVWNSHVKEFYPGCMDLVMGKVPSIPGLAVTVLVIALLTLSANKSVLILWQVQGGVKL